MFPLLNGPLNRTAEVDPSAAVYSWVRSSAVERQAVNLLVGGSIPSGLATKKPAGAFLHGRLAQLAAQRTFTPRVTGSTPVAPTMTMREREQDSERA